MGEDHRASLLAVATECQDDIAVADYLIAKYDDQSGHVGSMATATPGNIINWALRFDVPLLDSRIDALEKLKDVYNLITPSSRINDLRAYWDGDGAKAFESRWNGLRTHVSERPNDENLVATLKRQIEEMRALTRGAGEFQRRCAEEVTGKLKGLRKKYIQALVTEGDGADSAILKATIEGLDKGSGIGAAAESKGAAAGAGIGGVIGLIGGFITKTESHARELLRIDKENSRAGLDFRTAVDELARGLHVMDRDHYRKRTYDPQDFSSADDGELNREW